MNKYARIISYFVAVQFSFECIFLWSAFWLFIRSIGIFNSSAVFICTILSDWKTIFCFFFSNLSKHFRIYFCQSHPFYGKKGYCHTQSEITVSPVKKSYTHSEEIFLYWEKCLKFILINVFQCDLSFCKHLLSLQYTHGMLSFYSNTFY